MNDSTPSILSSEKIDWWAKRDEIFPLTDPEVDELHSLGWESGFGFRTQPDWYWTPSAGPAIWLEDAEDIGRRWLNELDNIRHLRAEQLRIQYLHDAAEELYEALAGMIESFDALAEDRKSRYQSPNGICAYDNARAALAKARGEQP